MALRRGFSTESVILLPTAGASVESPIADGQMVNVEKVQPSVAALLRIGDAPELAAAGQFAGVADLTPHLGVTGARVENDGGLVLERRDLDNLGRRFQFVVADELRGRSGFELGEGDDFLLLGGAGAGASVPPSTC
jgi:hypothetical protein